MKLDFHFHCNVSDEASVQAALAACKANDTMAVLSGGPHYGAHDYAPNDFVLSLARRYPEQFRALARFELWDKAPDPKEVYRLHDQGYVGLKCIYPYYPYDHDLYMPVYEAAENCGMPILFHTGNFRPSQEDIRCKRPILLNMNPLTLDRPARSFQKLHIVLAHLGTTFWREQAAEMLKMHANVYADLAGCGSWMALSPEQLVELLNPVFPLIDTSFSGFRKLVLGSDSYLNIPTIQRDAENYYEAFIRKVGIPKDIAAGIMGGTVASWIGVTL